jgi:hypothetical protein
MIAQNFGAAVSVVIATTIFTQNLLSDVARLVPSVNPQTVVAAGGGANAIRALVPPNSPELDGLLHAYNNSLVKVFYMMTAFAVVASMFAWGMGWKDIRRKKTPPSNSITTEKSEGV